MKTIEEQIRKLEARLEALKEKKDAPVKVPRKVVKFLEATLNKHGRALVVMGRKSFRVYTVHGHKKQSEGTKRAKPWLKAHGGRAMKKQTEATSTNGQMKTLSLSVPVAV